jgi:hypothetical protein
MDPATGAVLRDTTCYSNQVTYSCTHVNKVFNQSITRIQVPPYHASAVHSLQRRRLSFNFRLILAKQRIA